MSWIATDECIYEAIEDSFDEDDTEGLIKEIFEGVDSSLIEAALEPLGEDADDDETFIYLADDSGNDNAVELVHELLWEECLTDGSVTTPRRDMYKAISDDDDENSACLLGEFYCKKIDDEYIFEDVFESVVDNELDNFIRGRASRYTGGLGITSSDYDDLEEVCQVICGTTGNGIIGSSNVRPSTCT